MRARERFEYHLIEGRMVQRRLPRPQGKKLWRYSLDVPTLIAVVEPSGRSFSVHPGPAASTSLIVEAVSRYMGLYADPRLPDLGPEVPVELAKDLSLHVAVVLQQALAQYDSFAEETDFTGFLKGALRREGFSHDGWNAEIKTWTYKRRPKERDLGVDIGLIVDVIHRDLRTLKALWFQAKLADSLPEDIFVLPDLAEQVSKMQRYTRESYALIYTPEKVLAFRGDQPREALPLDLLVYDGVLCRRGDRDPTVIALTGDSRLVVEMQIVA